MVDNASIIRLDSKDSESTGSSPSYDRIRTSFFRACKNCDADKLRDILEHNVESLNVNAKNKYGSTPLILTCIRGNTEAIKLLIDHGADVDLVGPENWTALHCASYYGHPRACEVLLHAGADAFKENSGGRSPGLDFNSGVSEETAGEIQKLILDSTKYVPNQAQSHLGLCFAGTEQFSCEAGLLGNLEMIFAGQPQRIH
mmetsp:Transcript_40319/g.53098  ORF Transcript_40319/g.53098 Transcript_40319/m.53098 type:complete len:200 (-) Transcript_40319:80-679(-)|eukprot:CAMPEP_0117759410 /NCGR_PEP_ID=MMETSP0947-20121206/15992_1 /TAXON_ID=44440 /ORGANISM="Chattonella subsalsa, Strain CCMP2191" /LENGTH=199 /DNA_ID=CAMNT_0005579853 /DNA_START=192 /DNA_END=791 /DNA_ORIENTATION=-